ncbi:ATP-binding protein [Streptomyces sp. NPDC060194]|uniref:ATP-binding protein n=1 Tax=Streptomyces sp. NPDC060194 TaxID=3347069 RepID=UPI003666B715
MGTAARATVHEQQDFAGGATAIGASRDFAAAFLARTAGGDGVLVERARLVVSELVTNAVKYADGPLSLRLDLLPDDLRIEVADSSPVLPEAAGHDPERIGRHGLEIVKMLCRGIEVVPLPRGKRVVVLIPLR